jgi:DNA-binding IclR family transcriptional regulator
MIVRLETKAMETSALFSAPPVAAGERQVAGASPTQRNRPTVAPFARSLSLLAAFTAEARWLGNSDLVARTGLPASTVTRIAHSLVKLRYLRYAADRRKFCLAPSVLALGYGAAAEMEVQRLTLDRMRAFARQHQVHVNLSTRARLDLIVIDSCQSPTLPASLQLDVGTRLSLTTSAAGWALLASLPEGERHYLMRSADHHPQAGNGRLRLRSSEAMGQVREEGFCVSPGEAGQPMTMVAAPIRLPGQAPLAVSCMGPSTLMNRTRTVRELGPALVCLAQEIQQQRPYA